MLKTCLSRAKDQKNQTECMSILCGQLLTLMVLKLNTKETKKPTKVNVKAIEKIQRKPFKKLRE